MRNRKLTKLILIKDIWRNGYWKDSIYSQKKKLGNLSSQSQACFEPESIHRKKKTQRKKEKRKLLEFRPFSKLVHNFLLVCQVFSVFLPDLMLHWRTNLNFIAVKRLHATHVLGPGVYPGTLIDDIPTSGKWMI